MFKKLLTFIDNLIICIFVPKELRAEVVQQLQSDIHLLQNTNFGGSSKIDMDTKLMTAVDSRRLDDMEKLLTVVAINLHRLVEEEKKTQEYMVHLSTLHEELLNQLDQGHIAMVKVRREQGADDELDAMIHQEPEAAPKKKTEMN